MLVFACACPYRGIIRLYQDKGGVAGYICSLILEDGDEPSKDISVLCLDDDSVVSENSMKAWTAPQVVRVLTPIDHGFIVHLDVAVLYQLCLFNLLSAQT